MSIDNATVFVNEAPKARPLFLDANDERIFKIANFLKETLRPNVNFNDSLADNLTGFFIRELSEIETRMYEVLYKKLTAMTLFPRGTAANIGAERLIFNVVDWRAEAKTIADFAVKDFPRVSILLKQLAVPIASEGNSFGYTIQDLRAAAMANRPLDQMLANAARKGVEQRLNKILWFGDSYTTRVGVLTDPDVPIGAVPGDGSSGSTKFVDKTGQQILRDLQDAVNGVGNATGNEIEADNLVLPAIQYNYINSTPFAPQFQGKSILAFFKENKPGVTVSVAEELKNSSPLTPGESVMIAFNKNIDYAASCIPIPFEMFPPQMEGLGYTVLCHARTAGMIIRQPLSINIKEGI